MKTALKIFFTQDDRGQKIVQALCYNYNYQNKIIDDSNKKIDNPQSMEDFCVDIVIAFLKDNFLKHKIEIDTEKARLAVINSSKIEI